MWYRVKVGGDRFFVDEATLADMKADGEKFEVETANKWLEGDRVATFEHDGDRYLLAIDILEGGKEQ